MAIIYTEKGSWLHDEIAAQGHSLINQDSVWISSDDVAVQAIIDTFDPLPFAKAEARSRIKTEAATKVAALYPFIDADSDEAIGLYDFARDIYLSMLPAARGTLQPNLQSFDAIKTAAEDAITDVNALTDWQVVMAYDEVNTPLWP